MFNYLFRIELSVCLGSPSEVVADRVEFLTLVFEEPPFSCSRCTLYVPTSGVQALPLLHVLGWWLSVFLKESILMGMRWNLILVICTSPVPGLGRSPGEGNDKPLQYSCLGESHGQGSLEATGSQESDTTEQLNLT